jgi:imidazolonepropionase-like amidohydrolase
MIDCGMSATDALVATTKTAAELMGLDEELGTLEPGKRADVVVVQGDALDGLSGRVRSVWKDGVQVV